MGDFIFSNLIFILIFILIGTFIILRLKRTKDATYRDKKEIELLKERVEDLERNK